MNNIALRFYIVVLALCCRMQSFAQPFSKKYILSFHHCAIPNCGTPQNHTVYLAESDNAENWSLVPNFPSYQGSVPDLATRGSKLYIYTPGQVKRYDYTTNQWDANLASVSIVDSIGNSVQFVDPSVHVDDNGNLCLFFLNSTGIAGDPAYCANPPCTAYFDSAIEVPGSDGTQFVKQNGHRISYTTNTNFKPTDPDIFKYGNTFYQYISFGTGTIVYSSTALHGNYVQMPGLPNGYLTANNAGVPCGIYNNASNLFYSYGHRNTANGTEITLAKHPDHLSQPNYNTLFTGSSIGLGNVQVASPGICENTFLTTALQISNSENLIRIFPNPNHGNFEIHTEEEFSKVLICDLTGRIIQSYLKIQSRLPVSVYDLKKGVYIVQCFNGDGKVCHAKIIVQ